MSRKMLIIGVMGLLFLSLIACNSADVAQDVKKDIEDAANDVVNDVKKDIEDVSDEVVSEVVEQVDYAVESSVIDEIMAAEPVITGDLTEEDLLLVINDLLEWHALTFNEYYFDEYEATLYEVPEGTREMLENFANNYEITIEFIGDVKIIEANNQFVKILVDQKTTGTAIDPDVPFNNNIMKAIHTLKFNDMGELKFAESQVLSTEMIN